MATPKQRPGSVSIARVVDDAVREALSRGLGPGNYGRKSIGLGTPADGQPAGPHNSVWVFVKLAGSGGTIDVPHKLGSVPVSIRLDHLQLPATTSPIPHAHAQPVRKNEWTASGARVDVISVGGFALDGCIAVFEVRGA